MEAVRRASRGAMGVSPQDNRETFPQDSRDQDLHEEEEPLLSRRNSRDGEGQAAAAEADINFQQAQQEAAQEAKAAAQEAKQAQQQAAQQAQQAAVQANRCTDKDLSKVAAYSSCTEGIEKTEQEGGAIEDFCVVAGNLCGCSCLGVDVSEADNSMVCEVRPDSQLCANIQVITDLAGSEAATLMLQFDNTRVLAEAATTVMEQADTLLGIAMGIYCLRTLLPKSLSILTGLPLGLQNIKSLIFDHPLPGYLLILVTACVLPMYVGYLATIQQIVGDLSMIPVLFLLLVHISLGLWFGHRLAIKKELDELEQEFRLQAIQSGVVGLLVLVSIAVWVWNSKLRDYIDFDFLANGPVIVGLIFTFLASRILTQTAFTDTVMMMFASCPQIAGDSKVSWQVLCEYRELSHDKAMDKKGHVLE